MFLLPTLYSLIKPQSRLLNAGVFDGTNDYMSIGVINSGLLITSVGTLSLYIKRSSSAAVYLFNMSDGGASPDSIILRWTVTTANLVFTLNSPDIGNLYQISPGVSIPNDGKYHHLYITWNSSEGTTTGSLYMDGVFRSAGVGVDGIDIDYSTQTVNTIGARAGLTPGTNKLNGAIGQFGFWPGFIPLASVRNSDNTPATIPSNGQLVGIDPWIWLPNGGDSLATNQATGGNNFSVVGALGSEVITV